MDGKTRARRRALVLLVTSATLFGAMAFTAKLASANLPGAQIALIRFAIHLIPILIIPQLFRASLHFGRIDLLFYRGFFGGLAVLLYFVTIEHIPVGQATLLNYTAPVFSGLFAAVFIGEPVRPRIIVPVAVAFLGIALVVRGNATPASPWGMSRWALAGLSSAILSGAAVTALRVARRTEGSWPIFASFSLFGLLATAPFGLWLWRKPSLSEWTLLLLVGALSIGAQLTMTHAFRWIETLTAGIVSQLAVVISMVLGAVWLGERPTGLTLLGSLLTLGGVLAVMWVTSLPHPTAFDEAPEQ
jgi:drug/metabolite transporter (DMT)-like permease